MTGRIKECLECHREFVASRESQKYCSGTCRKRAFDRTHRTKRLRVLRKADGSEPTPEAPPPSVTLDEIALSVQSVRYAIATLSAGSLTAKHEYREFCKDMARDLNAVVDKYLPSEGASADA